MGSVDARERTVGKPGVAWLPEESRARCNVN
jgi:hypothetical protein